MSKAKRVQRIVGLTKNFIDNPSHLFSLADFCEEFKVAKSTLSEDIQTIRSTFEEYKFGTIETVTGAGGGVRYLPIARNCPTIKNARANFTWWIFVYE